MDHLGIIAHAIRSPLTGLSALVEMLEGGVDGPLNPAQSERLARIRRTLDRLVSVTDQVALLARSEQGRLELIRSRVDLGEVMLLAAEDAERIQGGRPIELQVRMDPTLPAVWADPSRLRELLGLLILESAAVAPGSTLMVEAATRGTGVSVSVNVVTEDDSNREGLSESSLGLALATSLVGLHGGTLTPGTGSLVAFTLPTRPAPPHLSTRQPMPPSPTA